MSASQSRWMSWLSWVTECLAGSRHTPPLRAPKNTRSWKPSEELGSLRQIVRTWPSKPPAKFSYKQPQGLLEGRRNCEHVQAQVQIASSELPASTEGS